MNEPTKPEGEIPPQEPETPKSPEKVIDYKAELEAEQKRRTQAEYNIEQERARRLKAEEELRARGEEPQPFDEDRARQIAREEADRVANRVSVDALITQRAQNADEAALVRFHYEHSIIPTGNPQEDVENAFLLANKKRIQAEIKEAGRAALSAITRTPGGGSGQPTAPDTATPLTPEEEKVAKATARATQKPLEEVRKALIEAKKAA